MYSSETGETGGKSATGAVRRLKVEVRSFQHFCLQPSDRLARPAFLASRAPHACRAPLRDEPSWILPASRLPFVRALGKMGAV
mgnify:CR=1 FL=1